jgi:hypothetical protein
MVFMRLYTRLSMGIIYLCPEAQVDEYGSSLLGLGGFMREHMWWLEGILSSHVIPGSGAFAQHRRINVCRSPSLMVAIVPMVVVHQLHHC